MKDDKAQKGNHDEHAPKGKKVVFIPPNFDLNDGLPPKDKEEYIPDFLPMSDELFDELPPLLRVACERLPDREGQEVFLMGAIGLLSGMLPNVQGMYMRRTIHPNLYCFIVGKHGTGKGALLWAKDLGEATDAYREQQAKQAIEKFAEEQAHYQRQVRLYDKGKLQEPPVPPTPPKHLKLYLPANSSKTALMQLLDENDGRGIIFETEGDTLADMLKQDYGNFNDVLRKGFHHEPVSYFRRANNEDVKITRPMLSVVLSGTQGQLHKLLPTIENGLFSRFMFYVLQSRAGFKDPFDDEGGDDEYYFARLADRFLAMYKKLEHKETPVQFALHPHQQKEFVRYFAAVKTEIQEHISDDLDGTVNRLGLITYRIAMVLTCIRFIDSLDGTLKCLKTDFNNALAISTHLLHYTLHVYEQIELRQSKSKEVEIEDKKEKIEEACRCRSMGMSYEEIAEQVLGSKTKSTTVWRWVDKHCKAG